jgi:hypothetical protein
LADWFACPLCGRQRPIAGWDPLLFDDEIKIRDVVGKGKGHGFEAASEWSASEYSAGLDLKAMAERCLTIVGLCLDSGEVWAEDLVEDVPAELVEAVLEQKGQH